MPGRRRGPGRGWGTQGRGCADAAPSAASVAVTSPIPHSVASSFVGLIGCAGPGDWHGAFAAAHRRFRATFAGPARRSLGVQRCHAFCAAMPWLRLHSFHPMPNALNETVPCLRPASSKAPVAWHVPMTWAALLAMPWLPLAMACCDAIVSDCCDATGCCDAMAPADPTTFAHFVGCADPMKCADSTGSADLVACVPISQLSPLATIPWRAPTSQVPPTSSPAPPAWPP